MKKPIEIFCVELELAPYKFDLWNEFTSSGKFELNVFFTEQKNYEKDASHNYLNFPKANFPFSVETGKNLKSKLFSIVFIFKNLIKSRFDYVYVSGYNHFVTFSTLLICILFNKPYLLNTDLIIFRKKKFIHNFFKKLFLRKAHKVLLCNKKFSDDKFIKSQGNIIDFTYYVSKARLLSDEPEIKPQWIQKLFEDKKNPIIFVSSRLIPRKGCDILLEAFKKTKNTNNSILLLEGDGIQKKST